MRQIFLILTICILLFSCKKDEVKAGKSIEFYLLKSYQLISEKCQVDASSAVLQDHPLVSNQDILIYSPTAYEYELTEASFQKVKSLEGRTPFAITVDKQVIFFGFFMPSYMSSTCDNSITMDVTSTSGNKVYLRLGYPWVPSGTTIDDQRNNPALLTSLANQGKLK